MTFCWANCLGNCSDKISREHIISRSLFEGEMVNVFGFPWCKNEMKEIGISSLTAKILCKDHNSNLSVLDTEAGEAFNVFRELRRVANVRARMKARNWNVLKYTINGIYLERWFLKTLINISVNSVYPIGISSPHAGLPSDLLVKIAFGLENFPGRSGLYFLVGTGQEIYSSDQVTFVPLIKDNKCILAGLFSFRGFEFLLSLHQDGPPDRLTGLQLLGKDLGNRQLNYHNERIDYIQGKYISQIIEINW